MSLTLITDIHYILFGYVLLIVNCGCYRAGSRQMTCDPKNKACDCLPGVGGLKCDKCKPGYWGLNPETRPNYTPGCASTIKSSFLFYPCVHSHLDYLCSHDITGFSIILVKFAEWFAMYYEYIWKVFYTEDNIYILSNSMH